MPTAPAAAGSTPSGYVEQICAMQAGDRGFTTVLTMTFPIAKQFEADRARGFADLSTLSSGPKNKK